VPASGNGVVEDLVRAALASARFDLLGPEILLTLTGLVALVAGALLPHRRQRVVSWVALLGVLSSLAFLSFQYRADPSEVTAFSGLFRYDAFALFFKYLFLVATWLTILMSMRYLDEEGAQLGEYYALLCFATLGMMFMASGENLITIYVGLELMALSIYVLVGFLKGNRRSNEAAMKYFILGAFSSAFFIYGISLFYGATGSTSLLAVERAIAEGPGNALVALGLITISVGLAFKVAAVPFHAWAPDVYEGAPTPITAYISVASKGAAVAVLLRILLVGLYDLRGQWTVLLWILAAASITLGNFVAVVQDNVKRMLAYSSIAHAGYLLVGVLAAGASLPPELAVNLDPIGRAEWMADLQLWAQGGVLLYLFAYTFMNLGAFALVTYLRRREIAGDEVKDFAGLFQRAPWMAIAMGIFLLSLAGIPPTAGFVGKLFLFGAAIKAQYYGLAVIAVLNTAVSVYFYFRIVVMMWMKEPAPKQPAYAESWGLSAVVVVALFFTLLVGVWPARFIGLAQRSILEVPAAAGAGLSRSR
jgi:NADH-quinone oxidoreductase subunit N